MRTNRRNASDLLVFAVVCAPLLGVACRSEEPAPARPQATAALSVAASAAPPASFVPADLPVPDVLPGPDGEIEISSVQITRKNYKEELDRLEKQALDGARH
jgi:hypothetical protein